MMGHTAGGQQKGVEQLFPALLFFVYIICTIFTILIGSRVYENIRTRDDITFRTDTVLAYLTNKIRQGDRAGAISLREIDGIQVMVLSASYAGGEYETWIYEKDGKLKELFSEAGSDLGIADGLEIMDCRDLSFVLEEDTAMLTISLGDARTARISLRSSREGGDA